MPVAYTPVTFVADCPICRGTASWTAYLRPNGRGGSAPSHHIDCPDCGPCRCPDHQEDDAA